MKRKRLIKKGVVKREPGTLYYIDGNGDLYAVKAKVGGTKGAKQVRAGYPYKWRKKKEQKNKK